MKAQRLIASLFLFGLLLSLAGYYPMQSMLHQRASRDIKQRIKRGVDEHELHHFHFKAGETVEWVKAGKEFKRGSELYDIVRFDLTQDGVWVHCINDTQEKELFAQLDSWTRQSLNDSSNPSHPTSQQLVHLLQLIYVVTTHDLGLDINMTDVAVGWGSYPSALADVHIELMSPPPEWV